MARPFAPLPHVPDHPELEREVLDRWRQNWNPWYHNFDVQLDAKPHDVRVEWDPNGGYIALLHSDPLPDATLYRILDRARFAPSGGNRQGWRVIVVEDPARRVELRDLYLPRWRAYTTLHWDQGGWEATIANTYIPGVTDIGVGGIVFATSTTLKAVRVASYTTWDLSAGYTFRNLAKGLRFMVGVNNIADRMPPRAPQAFPDNNADVATYSPIGRLWYATVSVKF